MSVKTQKIIVFVILIICVCFSVASFAVQFLPEGLSAAEIYEKCLKNVVEVKSVTEDVAESYGTGEILHEDGTLITNAHVVTFKRADAVTEFENYYVRFSYEEGYRRAELENYDSDCDLAVLKITDLSGAVLSPLETSSSDGLNYGDKIYAVGNASNFGIGIFSGTVSIPSVTVELDGLKRRVIQCDVTIAAGNSGGALLDKNGNLVGITTFRTKDNMNNVVYGIVYAIPIKIVLEFID